MIDKFNLDTMFTAIQGCLDKTDKPTNIDYSNILKFEIGKTYKLRLIPFVNDPSKTIIHYIEYGWTSKATDNYVSAISPSTWQEPCPISEVYRKGFKDRVNTSGIKRREQWLVNVFVVDDPSHPENNGTVKVFRYGKQIDKIIQQATVGDLSDELGKAVFDVTSNGYDFIVRCEKQQEFPNYSNSSFARRPSALPGIGDDEAKITEIYSHLIDLSSLCKVKSYESLQKMLDEHYYVTNKVSVNEDVETSNNPSDIIEPQVTKSTPQKQVEPSSSTTPTDDDLDKLIADL